MKPDNGLIRLIPGRMAREKYLSWREEGYLMTREEVDALTKAKTRNKVRIRRLEEREGEFFAFLSYSH
jgi:hypothetical protein